MMAVMPLWLNKVLQVQGSDTTMLSKEIQLVTKSKLQIPIIMKNVRNTWL